MDRFSISVSDDVLTDLRSRLARTRYPDQLDGTGWDYGAELGYLQDLCAYWAQHYDWREHEARLNKLNHFTTDIDGLRLHFLHERSPHADALPLLLTHGWPGSFIEFEAILGPLTRPEEHGGSPGDAFHVVCPSIPGYGFSQAPPAPGFDIRQVAEIHAALMAKLGYERYAAQGGDWGSVATAWLGVLDSEHVCALHVNMPLGKKPQNFDPAHLSSSEREGLDRARAFRATETGYQAIQGTKPQTLGYALNDSPAGLAAWIVEKFRTWSDCGGDIEMRFTKDTLLTNIMLYWINANITASMRLYCETMRAGRFGPPDRYVHIPTGVAVFPGEIQRLPRAYVEECFNLTHWAEMERGGHFAAMEEPDLFVADVRAFFRTHR